MRRVAWDPDGDPPGQLRRLIAAARDLGVLVVGFGGGECSLPIAWSELEPWTRSRAITVADIAASLATPALDVALCADLVYLRRGAVLRLPPIHEAPPAPGVLWALGRAGRPALARGLLHDEAIVPEEAVRLGLAQATVRDGDRLPLPETASLAALTAARDLMRTRASGAAGLDLELAAFRLAFATGDPEEGARAFLGKRIARFGLP